MEVEPCGRCPEAFWSSVFMYLGDVSWHLVPVQTLAFHHPSLAWRGLRAASYCHHLDGRTGLVLAVCVASGVSCPGESIAKDKDISAFSQRAEGIRAPMLYYPPDCPSRFCGKHGLRECETLTQGQTQLGCDSTPGLSSPCSLPPEAFCSSSCPGAASLPHEAASILYWLWPLLSFHGSKSPKLPSVTQP